jgi:hypothetical protein
MLNVTVSIQPIKSFHVTKSLKMSHVYMIGLFDHKPLLENKIFGKDITVFQSLQEMTSQDVEYTLIHF